MATPDRTQNGKHAVVNWLQERKPLTLVGLLVLLVSTYFGYYSVWGALFVFWGLSSVVSGQTFLLEPIDRGANPILFWGILITWVGSGILYILTDIYPQY